MTIGRKLRADPRAVGRLCRLAERTYRDEVGISDRANIGAPKGDERLRATGCRHELDLETVRLGHMDDRAEITHPESVLGKVSCQNGGVEFLESHDSSPG